MHDDQDCQILCLAASLDEKLVIFGDEGGHIKIFDTEQNRIIKSTKDLGGPIKTQNQDQQENFILTYEHNILIIDKNGGQQSSFSIDKKNGEIISLKCLGKFQFACMFYFIHFIMKLGNNQGHFYTYDLIMDQEIGNFKGEGAINPGEIKNIIYDKEFNIAVMGCFDGSQVSVEMLDK